MLLSEIKGNLNRGCRSSRFHFTCCCCFLGHAAFWNLPLQSLLRCIYGEEVLERASERQMGEAVGAFLKDERVIPVAKPLNEICVLTGLLPC